MTSSQDKTMSGDDVTERPHAAPTKDAIYEASNRIYDEAAAIGATPYERVLGHDLNRQYLRFHEIRHFLGDLTSPSLSVLDVGCGNGEFFRFLNSCGFSGRYAGIDINETLLREAVDSLPASGFENISFAKKDIFEDRLGTFDFVVMSGIFNINMGHDDAFVFEMIRRMAAHAGRKTVFNAVSTHVSFRDPRMYYLDPAKVVDFVIREISPRVELRHHILPFNYTLCVHTDAHWQSATSGRAAR